tara:strand:+ start:1043 stop:1207 length:165 start_codon:yes stop_codon:yes gene_type:complete
MKRIGVIADEVIESLCRAQAEATDPEVKNIWKQKVAEVARRKENLNAETTRQSS